MADKPIVLCSFFRRGECSYGANCRYVHCINGKQFEFDAGVWSYVKPPADGHPAEPKPQPMTTLSFCVPHHVAGGCVWKKKCRDVHSADLRTLPVRGWLIRSGLAPPDSVVAALLNGFRSTSSASAVNLSPSLSSYDGKCVDSPSSVGNKSIDSPSSSIGKSVDSPTSSESTPDRKILSDLRVSAPPFVPLQPIYRPTGTLIYHQTGRSVRTGLVRNAKSTDTKQSITVRTATDAFDAAGFPKNYNFDLHNNRSSFSAAAGVPNPIPIPSVRTAVTAAACFCAQCVAYESATTSTVPPLPYYPPVRFDLPNTYIYPPPATSSYRRPDRPLQQKPQSNRKSNTTTTMTTMMPLQPSYNIMSSPAQVPVLYPSVPQPIFLPQPIVQPAPFVPAVAFDIIPAEPMPADADRQLLNATDETVRTVVDAAIDDDNTPKEPPIVTKTIVRPIRPICAPIPMRTVPVPTTTANYADRQSPLFSAYHSQSPHRSQSPIDSDASFLAAIDG